MTGSVKRTSRSKAKPDLPPLVAQRRPTREEATVNVEYLLVHFKENRNVLADDIPIGVTNHIAMLQPGGYEIKLDGDGYSPSSQTINLMGTSIVRPMIVVFT